MAIFPLVGKTLLIKCVKGCTSDNFDWIPPPYIYDYILQYPFIIGLINNDPFYIIVGLKL